MMRFLVMFLVIAGWAHAQDRDTAAQAALAAYSKALTSQDYGAAYALLSPARQAQQTPLKYSSFEDWLFKEFGAITRRSIVQSTWYPKETSGEAHTFLALDFAGTREKAPISCGYILLVELPQGFLVNRTDELNHSAEVIKGANQNSMVQALARPGCQSYLDRAQQN